MITTSKTIMFVVIECPTDSNCVGIDIHKSRQKRSNESAKAGDCALSFDVKVKREKERERTRERERVSLHKRCATKRHSKLFLRKRMSSCSREVACRTGRVLPRKDKKSQKDEHEWNHESLTFRCNSWIGFCFSNVRTFEHAFCAECQTHVARRVIDLQRKVGECNGKTMMSKASKREGVEKDNLRHVWKSKSNKFGRPQADVEKWTKPKLFFFLLIMMMMMTSF